MTPAIFQRRCLLIIALLALPFCLAAQEAGSCAENLKSAQSFFDKGQIDQIPPLLTRCLKSGFKKEEELSAYKLLIQTYLLNDKLEEADSTMLEFLKKNPEYVLSPTDHSSFVYLFNSFKVKPVVRIGVHAGVNKPFLTFVDEEPVMGNPGTSSFSSKASNLFFSVDAQFKVTQKIDIGIELGYSQLSFSNEVEMLGMSDIIFSITKYNETQHRIEIPVSMTYDIGSFGRFTPYAKAGIGAAYNLGTSAEVSNIPTDPNNLSSTRTGKTLKRLDSRVPLDFFGQMGIGMKIKIPRVVFFGEIRTSLGTLNQNISKGQTLSTVEGYYLWSDPGFRINSITFNVGFNYIFYKPSKRAE